MEDIIKIGYLNICSPNKEGEFLVHNPYDGHTTILTKEQALKLVDFITHYLK